MIVSYTKNKLYKIILSSLMLLESCLLQQNCRNYSCEFFLQSGSYQKYCPFIYLQLVCQYSGMVVVIKSFTHRLTLRNDEFHAHSTFHATKLQGTFNGFELVPPPAKTDGVLLWFQWEQSWLCACISIQRMHWFFKEDTEVQY